MFLNALHGEFSVFVFARTVELVMAYDDSGFIIWENISVVWSQYYRWLRPKAAR